MITSITFDFFIDFVMVVVISVQIESLRSSQKYSTRLVSGVGLALAILHLLRSALRYH